MFADVVPLYPLYAVWFADTGLSGAEISALFALWSAVAIIVEVPSGALADRFSRRGALVAGGVLQAAGYALWIALPDFAGFAAGFVLWGFGGALFSGALEALLYDGLAAVGAETHYPRVLGWVTAMGLFAQLPAAVAATVLFAVGGYELVGWISIGSCLAAAALASRLPEPPRARSVDDGDDAAEPAGYLMTLRAGLVEATARSGVPAVLLAVAMLSGLDGLEEYAPLLAQEWGVPTGLVPLAALSVPLAGAVGAALGGAASGLRPSALTAVLGVGVLALGAAGFLRHPIGLVGVALFYGLLRLVLVIVDARLQERIEGPARATVTSVAGLGSEVAAFALFAAWALGEVMVVTALALVVTAALPRLLRLRAAV